MAVMRWIGVVLAVCMASGCAVRGKQAANEEATIYPSLHNVAMKKEGMSKDVKPTLKPVEVVAFERTDDASPQQSASPDDLLQWARVDSGAQWY